MRRVLVLISAAGVVALLLWMQREDPVRVERRGSPLPTGARSEHEAAETSTAEDAGDEHSYPVDDDPRRIPGPQIVLTGRVERNGQRVPNADIDARRYDEPIGIAESRTDAAGAFRLTFARRTKLVLTARDQEGRSASVLVLIPDKGNPDDVIIRLKDAHPFGGIILNPDGTPHAGASVRLTSGREWHDYATETGEDGRFAFAHVNSGSYEIHIEADGFPVIRRFADVPGLRDFKATLFAGGSIRGTLRDDAARPIGGATITLHSGDGRKSPAGIATVVTQADGSFHMPTVMPGPCWSAAVWHPERGCHFSNCDEVTLPADPVRRGEELSWNITLPPSSTLNIRVVAEESGAPLTGALVSVISTRHRERNHDSDELRPRLKRTDARGVASFSYSSSRDIYVRVRHPFRMLRRRDEFVTGQPIWSHLWSDNEYVLACALTGMVEGRLRGGHAAELGGSGIKLILGSGTEMWSSADGTGRIRFLGVPQTRNAILVGYAAQVRSGRFDVVAGERTWVDVDLPYVAAMTGVVIDQERNPVAGAKVRVVPTREVEAVERGTEKRKWRWKWAETTNERGQFAIFSKRARGLDDDDATPPGEWSVVVRHPDYGTLRKDGLDPPNEEAPQSITVELRSGESIEGAVHFATGQPAPNIPVEALPEGTSPDDQAPRRVMSDSNGKFTLRGLKDGTWALKALHGEGVSRPVSARAGARDVRITIEMHPPITGLVLDDEDRPLSGALVELVRYRQKPLTTRTEPNGRFRIEHVPPGRHTIRVKPSQWLSPSGLRGSPHFPEFKTRLGDDRAEDMILRMERGYRLAGRVLDGRGKAVPRATVIAHLSRPWMVVADADGEFLIQVADDSPVTVYATGAGQPVRAAQVVPGSGLTEIKLPPKGSIRGRVLDTDGQPKEGVLVRAWAEVDNLGRASRLKRAMLDALRIPARWTTTTAKDGSFTIPDIEAGAYKLTAKTQDGASATERVQTDGPPIDLQLAK